jgi:hypothetical protein
VQAVVAAATTGAPADAAIVYKPAHPAATFAAARRVDATLPVAKPSLLRGDARAAIDRFAHLSDHAFWETLVPDDAFAEAPGPNACPGDRHRRSHACPRSCGNGRSEARTGCRRGVRACRQEVRGT